MSDVLASGRSDESLTSQTDDGAAAVLVDKEHGVL